jgi:hypothetical protein
MVRTSGLITYNAFANPAWFRFAGVTPMAWLALLTFYGGCYGDKATVGGVAGGYLAFLLAL